MRLIARQTELLRHIRSFANLPACVIEATSFEAFFLLRGIRQDTRLGKRNGLDEGFRMRLAVICIAVNYSRRAFLSNSILFGMVELIEFVYHIDPLFDEELSDRSPETLYLIEKLLY